MSIQKIFGVNDYIEYQPGDLNVIICIPHGGKLRPAHIPNRDAGAMVDGKPVYSHSVGKKDFKQCPVKYKRDDYTKELGTMLADELCKLTKKRPHVVINHLYRGKMDANCDLDQATFHVKESMDAWHSFHNFIEQAKSAIKGPGLFLDIHGQAHPEDWIELGYTIPSDQLSRLSYTYIESSIHSLAQRRGMTDEICFRNLLYGPYSLGGILEKQGYTVVPSPSQPAPYDKHFYSGGYNTRRHGSRNGGIIDGIQIESPKSLRKKDTAPQYAAALAKAIVEYMQMHHISGSQL